MCNKLLFMIFSILSVQVVYASSCDTSNTPGHYVDRYFDNEDGTITDKMTNLMWMKCDVNIEWDNTNKVCQLPIPDIETGEIIYMLYTWQQALNNAKDSDFNGYTDWRLPNVKELGSIYEPGCALDKGYLIDREFFTITTNYYWTSSPSFNSQKSVEGSHPNHAWSFSFRFPSHGALSNYSINQSFGVRLVRNNNQ